MGYLTVPISPLGARTVSPTRMASGDPFVETLVLRGCWDVDRDAGLDGMLEFVDRDFRPRLLLVLLLVEEVGERVGDVKFVPRETRGGRESLLPGPLKAEGRPMGVGVEYIQREDSYTKEMMF